MVVIEADHFPLSPQLLTLTLLDNNVYWLATLVKEITCGATLTHVTACCGVWDGGVDDGCGVDAALITTRTTFTETRVVLWRLLLNTMVELYAPGASPFAEAFMVRFPPGA